LISWYRQGEGGSTVSNDIDRLDAWVNRFNGLAPNEQTAELARVRHDFYRAPESHILSFSPDMVENTAAPSYDLDADSSDAETASKVKELLQFIRDQFGKRCVIAAQAVMEGCFTGAEVGAKMGVARQTADGHLANLQSKAVQQKALQLGLVTRKSFIESLAKAQAKIAKPARTVARKVRGQKSEGRRRARIA